MKTASFGLLGFFVLLSLLYYLSFTNQSRETINTTVAPTEKFSTKKTEIEKLQNDLQARITDVINVNKATNISVYFSFLEEADNLQFSINNTDHYSPASMAKVFLMTELLKRSEADPKLLKKKIEVKDNDLVVSEMYFRPEETLLNNNYYTLEELNKRMIVYSDNKAFVMLVYELNIEDFRSIFKEFRIDALDAPEDYITVDNFAKVFHVLYNGEYLTKEDSEYALGLLTQTKFENGLIKHLPKEIKVAHKFGERKNKNIQQLHDCGIIFYPKDPYVLCVMTRGTSIQSQSEVIADTSAYVYKTLKASTFFGEKPSPIPTRETLRKKKLYNTRPSLSPSPGL